MGGWPLGFKIGKPLEKPLSYPHLLSFLGLVEKLCPAEAQGQVRVGDFSRLLKEVPKYWDLKGLLEVTQSNTLPLDTN